MQNVVKNQDGRSPFQGAQLKVVSVNHKRQGANPIFDKHRKDSSDESNSIEDKQKDHSNASVPDKSVDDDFQKKACNDP